MNAQHGQTPPSIGLVFSRAFGVMGANPVPVFGIAFLFGALPQLATGLLRGVRPGNDPDAQFGVAALWLVFALLGIVCSGLAQAAIVRATGAFIGGRTATLGESLQVGLAKALPGVGLTILFCLGVGLGLILLLVPGLILGVMWSASIPALVEEDASVLGAFGRSRALTKGARWTIFFVIILVLLMTWLVSGLAAVPALMAGIRTTDTAHPFVMLLSVVTNTISTAIWASILTSLYFALRDWKDGPRTDRLVDVFA